MIVIRDILIFLDSKSMNYNFFGNENDTIDSFSSLKNYKPNSMSWIKSEDSKPNKLDSSKIKLLICQENVQMLGQNTIKTTEAKKIFFAVIETFFSKKREMPSIGKFTYIGPEVKFGNNVKIGCNCTLDGDITIGDNTIIYHNVSMINKVSIGKNCVIQSGVNIGDEGYAYVEDDNHRKTMVRQHGGVTISDDVLIGPNTTVQNGAIDDTYIGKGCKISGNCFISHNSVIGENAAIIVSVLHGSVTIGRNAYIVSSVVRNQAEISDDVFVGLGSVVTKDITDEGITVVGVPAKPFSKK